MKSILLTTFFSFTLLVAYGQDSLALFKRSNIGLIELNPIVGAIIGPDGEYALSLGVTARFGYFLRSQTAVLLDFSTVSSRSNTIAILKSSTNFGLALRQYLGKSKRNGFYTQLGYNLTDYRLSKINGQPERHFPSSLITGNLGMSLRLKPNWYLNYSVGYNYSTEGASYLSNNIGISYLFNNKYKDYPKIQRDTASIKRQRDSLSCKGQFQVSNDFFVFPFGEEFGEHYTLYEWNSRIGYFIGKSLSVGIMGGLFYGQPRYSDSKLFYVIGPYANFRILKKTKAPLYFELGYAYSNLSIQDIGLPKSLASHYLNTGVGMNIRLKENTYLDLGIVRMSYLGAVVKCKECGGAAIWRIGIETLIK